MAQHCVRRLGRGGQGVAGHVHWGRLAAAAVARLAVHGGVLATIPFIDKGTHRVAQHARCSAALLLRLVSHAALTTPAQRASPYARHPSGSPPAHEPRCCAAELPGSAGA